MIQLIPSLDLLGGRIVRLRHGDPNRVTFYDLAPEAWIERLVGTGARRIHLVDLDGAFGRSTQAAFAAFPATYPGVTFQLGGGLRTREAIQGALDQGFEAVVGTLAVERPRELVGLPPAKVICALDLKGDRVATRGWTAESACETTDVFETLLTFGFRRALVTDIGRDGTLEGPGLEAINLVAREGFEVQASGGLRDLADLELLAALPGVTGAISGKALLDGCLDLNAPATRNALMGGT